MTKEQLFERLDFEEGDRIHITKMRDVVIDGVERTHETRINHGISAYELLGLYKRIEHDILKKIGADVEVVKRVVLVDEVDALDK